MEWLPRLCAALFVAAATYTDIRSMRIPNKLTMPAAGVGIVLRFALCGWDGLLLALVGLAGAFAMTWLLHMVGAVGAGDVKAFAALGAMLGFGDAMQILAYALLYGAAAGLLLIAVRNRLRVLASNIVKACIGLIVLGQWRLSTVRSGEATNGSALVFPFMAAVLPGFLSLFLFGFPSFR